MPSLRHDDAAEVIAAGPRLDRVARRLAKTRSRRVMVGGALGALGAAFGIGASADAGARPHRPCPRPTVECGRRCVRVERNRRHCGGCRIRCKKNEVCRKYRCLHRNAR